MQDQASASITKPAEVQRAVNLLWISFAIGVVRMAEMWPVIFSNTLPAWIGYFLVLAFASAIQLYFIRRISEGKNWARLFCLVVFLLGSGDWFSRIASDFASHPVASVLGVVSWGLEAFAYFLLFTGAGNEWFRTQPVTPPDPQITQYQANMQQADRS